MWNPKHQKELAIPLRDLPEQTGSWEYSEIFRDVTVAKEWGLEPVEFWNKSRISRAFMIAFCEVSSFMQSFEINSSKIHSKRSDTESESEE